MRIKNIQFLLEASLINKNRRAEDTTKLSSRPQEFLLGDESLLLQF